MKCFECGRYNQPTKEAMCDKCLENMDKPIKLYILILLSLLFSGLGIIFFEIQLFWLILGTIIGYTINRIIERLFNRKKDAKTAEGVNE